MVVLTVVTVPRPQCVVDPEESKMLWARMVAYVTGTVNQELLLWNECLGAENRILRGQINGRLLLSEGVG
jgi:hypothetical protein